MFCSRHGGLPALGLAALALLLACSGCRQTHARYERLAVLPIENLTSDASLDWESAASREALVYDLEGASGIYAFAADPIQPDAVNRPTEVLRGYFVTVGGQPEIHASVEDVSSGKTVRVIVEREIEHSPGEQGVFPLINRLAQSLGGKRKFPIQDTAALRSLGEALESSDPQARLRLLETAFTQNPSLAPAKILAAQQLLESGDRAQAAKIASEGGGHDPLDSAQLSYLLAESRDSLTASEQALEQWRRLAPANPNVLVQLGQVHSRLRKFPSAVADYQAALRLDPGDSDLYNLIGYARAWEGDLKGATDSLKAYGKTLSASDVNALDSLGEVNFSNGNFAAAENYFEQAYHTNSSVTAELLKIAEARLLRGDAKGADQAYADYEKARPDLAAPVKTFGQTQWLFLTGRRKQAIEQMKGLAASQDRALASSASAQLTLWAGQTGDRAAADQIMQRASPFLHGIALLLEGQATEAVPLLRQAFYQTNPSADGKARTLLAWALIRAGKQDEAAQLVDRYPFPVSATDTIFDSLAFPRFLAARAAAFEAKGKAEDARKARSVYNLYAGDVPDKY